MHTTLNLMLFAFSMLLTAALCINAIPIGQKFGVIDNPTCVSGHKSHANPTPAVGGLILGFVVAITFLASLKFSASHDRMGDHIRGMCLTAVLASMTVGFFDDRKHIQAVIRLLLGAIITTTLLLVVPELQLERLEFPSLRLSIQVGCLALPITVLCFLALKNAVNMADGRNGLLLGMSIIWLTFFIFQAHPNMLPTMFGILGCLIVLFIFNVQDKLFMGDCGSYGIATYFGIIALALHQNALGNVGSAEVILMFMIPMLDTIRLIFVRIANGQSPMSPDGQHLHHLLDNAFGWLAGWFVYMALIAIPLVISQFLPAWDILLFIATIAAYSIVVWVSQQPSYLPQNASKIKNAPPLR